MGADKPPLAPEGQTSLDLAMLREQTGGDAALEREVLGLFLKRSSEELARLRSAETAEERQRIAHGLVGTAKAVGAVAVARAAASIERGDTRTVAALEAAIVEAHRQIARHLKQ